MVPESASNAETSWANSPLAMTISVSAKRRMTPMCPVRANQFGGVGEHVVAKHDRGRVAKGGVSRDVAAPGVGVVNHVVVNEGGSVQQLD